MKRTEECKTEVSKFELKLPEKFDIKPNWVVDLPGGRKAHIYEEVTTREVRRPGGEWVETPVPGWRVIIVSRSSSFSNRYGNCGHSFHRELDVLVHLQELVYQFAETTDYDDE